MPKAPPEQTEDLKRQLEDLGSQQYYPWNWFGDRAAQLEEQRREMRRRLANSYQFEGSGMPQRPLPQAPLQRAAGGWVHLPSHKHVPNRQYGYTRHPSSVPGPSVGGVSGDSDGGGGTGMADGGPVEDSIRNIPQNELLGALSRVFHGVDNFTKPARDIPYAGALVPSFDSLSKVLEEASYGMPLTTGKGIAGTLNIKPDVGLGALDAAQLTGLGKFGKGIGRTVRRPNVSNDAIEAMFGSGDEWSKAKSAWDAAHGYAGGGLVKGALSRIAKMVGAEELPAKLSPLQAVKEQGGQWLPGSAKKFVENVKYSRSPGVVDSWAEKAIPKYIERYMGAKGDPLANAQIPYGQGTKSWEELTDPLISRTRRDQELNLPDWAQKLPPETYLHSVLPDYPPSSSVKSYISHVLDHAATLPPEKLKNYDFPRLVQEVQKIDAERVKKMASVEGRMEGTIPYKEYPEGYKWVEVQSPEALKLEGDVMGHCVGGYCEDVKAGRRRILSLRDPQGQSHVTVEVAKPKYTTQEVLGALTPEEKEKVLRAASNKGYKISPEGDVTGLLGGVSSSGFNSMVAETIPGSIERIKSAIPPVINQIKGKQNLAPKPEYQKYVQDLIHSGQYGDVRDIQNAGLRRSSDVFGPTELQALKERGQEVGNYLTQDEIDNLQKVFSPEPASPMRRGGKVRKYAIGGSITPDVVNAVIQTESRGNPRAVSPKGAQGLAQFMPGTAKDLGIDPLNPIQAREGAGRYLNWLIKQTGSLKGALAAYNWGIGNIKKYGTTNLPKETEAYVNKVLGLLGKKDAGQSPTLASAPVNATDTTPQPSTPDESTSDVAEAGAAAGTPSLPMSGGSSAMPRMAGYGRISGPMPGSIGTKNPNELVSAILKDPMSLATGVG